MIFILDRLGPALRVGQYVRYREKGRDKPIYSKIIRVVRDKKKKTCQYEIDRTYFGFLPSLFAESELEPVLEVFFAELDSSDPGKGFALVVRNGLAPVHTLGVIVRDGKKWRAKATGARTFLPETFSSRKKAAMELIQRRRKATRTPNL